MRKFLIAVLSIVLALCALCFVGCGSETSWENPGFTDFGETVSGNGFLAETKNYVLFINGVASSSSDNTYKAPVKGSLMAIKKSDLKDGKYSEAKIVVPKLFVASDFNSGLFISGDYVYFGTPSTAKNASGAIANDVLVFTKAKIDGSEKPEEIFSVSAISTEYRIFEKDGAIYFVYFEDSALKVYSTATKTSEIIAKTDDTANDKVGDVYPSLDTYKFVNDGSSVAVVFTAKLFTEEYFAEKAKKEDYARATASYNAVYAYSIGDGKADGEIFLGKKVISSTDKTTTVTAVKSGYVFYKTADINANEKNFAIKTTDLADSSKAQEIINADLVADTSLIVDLTEVYYVDATSNKLVKASLTGEIRESKVKLCDKGTISKILFKDGDFLYYTNEASELMRKNLGDLTAKDVRVSVGTVNTSWYAPEIVKLDGKDLMFYCDSTTVGSSYVYCIDLGANVIAEDTDDNDEDDLFYLEYTSQNDLFIGVMTDADESNKAVDAINAIESTLEFEEDENGKLISKKVNEARKVYDGLKESAKAFVNESYLTKLNNAEKAVELANYYVKLKGIQKADDKATYKTAYESAKSFRESLIGLSEDGSTYTAIRDMVNEELKYYYQEAVKAFETSDNK